METLEAEQKSKEDNLNDGLEKWECSRDLVNWFHLCAWNGL